MARPRRLALRVEPLEGRALLSGFAHHAGAVAELNTKLKTVHLLGTVRGTYSATIFSGVPINVVVNGSGRVLPLGPVAAIGVLSTVSQALTPGQANVVLGNQSGQVVLSLTSSSAPSSLTKPFKISFAIVQGFGAYSNYTGKGTAVVTISPNLATLGGTGTFSVRFQAH
jgi:hypothetical protein